MKIIIYILPLIALISSCAKKTPIDPYIVIKEIPKPLSQEITSQLRHPETLRKYAVGRYTDPNNRLVMHEAHDIYRVETTNKWNQKPQRAKSQLSQDRQYPKHFSETQNSEEITRLKQELANERNTTSTVIAANKKLTERITPLTQSFKNTKILIEQNAELRRQLHTKRSQESSPTKSQDPPESNLKEWFDSSDKK